MLEIIYIWNTEAQECKFFWANNPGGLWYLFYQALLIQYCMAQNESFIFLTIAFKLNLKTSYALV